MENERLNIVMAVDTFYPVVGGVSTVVDLSATALSEKANVTVVCVKAKGYDEPERKYSVLRCDGYYNKLTKDGMAKPYKDKEFLEKLDKMRIDLIVCHTAGNLMSFFNKYAKKRKIPLTALVHNTMYGDAKHYAKLPFLARWITKGFMKKTNQSDHVWCVSKFCRDYLIDFGLKKDASV